MASPDLELQSAVVAALTGDAAVMALVSGVYDRVPSEPWGSTQGYISFGPEDTAADEGGCVGIDTVSLQLDIWSRQVGRVHCKQILAAVRTAMQGLMLADNQIVARANPFQMVMRDPDGLTTHGVLRYEFHIEAQA